MGVLFDTTPVSPRKDLESGETITPIASQTFMQNIKGQITAPVTAAIELGHLAGLKGEIPGEDLLKAIKRNDARTDLPWTQRTTDWIGAGIGMALNPLGPVGGKIAGTALTKGAEIAAPYIAESVAKRATQALLPELQGSWIPGSISKASLASLAQSGTIGAGAFIGIGAGESIVENYDKNTNHLNVWGAIQAEAMYGGQGFAMGLIPFTLGAIWGKAVKGRGEKIPVPGSSAPEQIKILKDAEKEGLITSDELNTSLHALEEPFSDKLPEMINKVKPNVERPFGSSNKNINLEFYTESDLENLRASDMDQNSTHMSDDVRSNLTDYISDSRQDQLHDYILKNPSTLPGLRGVAEHIRHKLAHEIETLQATKKLVSKIPDTFVKANPLSQDSLYKRIMKGEINPEESPYTIPKRVLDRVNQTKNKVPMQERIKVMNKKEELEHLEKRLLPDNKLRSDYKATRDYYRLLELAEHSEKAKGLLYEVDLHDQYRQQKDRVDFIDQFIDLHENGDFPLADKNKVTQYLEERADATKARGSAPEIKKTAEQYEKYEQAAKDESMINDQREAVHSSGSEELIKQFKTQERKLNEFKSNKKVFENLVKCVWGAVGGKL